MKTLLLFALVALTLTFAQPPIAAAQDYEREARFAEQIESQLVVGDSVKIINSNGKPFLGLFTAGQGMMSGDKKPQAILLLHGVGTHPDSGIIAQLRAELAEQGFTTLAIQLPVQAKEAKLEDYYPKVFGDAKSRITAAIQWLGAKGYQRPVLLSHSMGSWMANEYLDENHSKNTLSAWVCMSLTGSYSWGMRGYKMPILDVYAEFDVPAAVSAAWRRKTALGSEGSAQFLVKTAQADYSGHAPLLATQIKQFLNQPKLQ
jgi:triacylglycerol esterase/lipase EstA (alpha/beta hydrolase family)